MAIQNPQVPLFGRVGSGGLQPTLNGGTLVIGDFDYTMQFPDWTAHVLIVTSSVALTATRRIVAPLGGAPPGGVGFHEFLIYNGTTGNQDVLIIGASGAGAAVPNGKAALVVSDGTNYYTAGALPPGPESVTHGDQTAPVSGTILSTSANTAGGLYRLSFYYVVRQAGGTGNVQLKVNWNDGFRAQEEAVQPLENELGMWLEDQIMIRVPVGQAITYSTEYVSSSPLLRYALYLSLEKLFS